MECKDFRLNISTYIDNMLEEKERESFLVHLEQCGSCRLDYENVKMIVESVHEIEEVELPPQFVEEFRSKLEKEAQLKEDEGQNLVSEKKLRKRTKLLTSVAAGFAILLVSFSLLNSPSYKGMKTGSAEDRHLMMDNSVANEEMVREGQQYGIAVERANPPASLHATFTSEDSVRGMAEVEISEAKSAINNRMRIKRGRLRIEVENFNEVYDAILATINAHEGYIQNSEIYQYGYGKTRPDQNLRYANMTLRVPSQAFFVSYEALKGFGVVTSHTIDEEDITERYRDIENEVKNLQVQEERLRELFQKGEKIEDLLKIENELSRIRLEINSLMGSLKNYDNLVSMSTIQLEVQEVGNEELRLRTLEEGFWNKAQNNFINSINQMIRLSQGLAIGLFGLLPPLMVIGPLAFLGVRMYKRFKANRES